MSAESISRVVSLRSPSDFLGAVMRGGGRAKIEREDVLGALSTNKDKLGAALLHYWLYEEGKTAAENNAVRVTAGAWQVKADFPATPSMVRKFGLCALLMIQKPEYNMKQLIAYINDVKQNTITKTPEKYAPQFEFLGEMYELFSNSLFKAKIRLCHQFMTESD